MPLNTVVRERCRPFLPAGARINYLFPALSLRIGGGRGIAGFLVVVTGTEVVVLGCSRWRRNVPRSVWARYARTKRLGPVNVHPSLGPTVRIGSLLLEIDEEYVAVVRAADIEIDEASPPEDPLPGL